MAIIGISGKIGSGKDTLAKFIQEMDPRSNWQVHKFAGKLKLIASILTGIPVEEMEKEDVKQSFLGPEWDTFVVHNYGKPTKIRFADPIEAAKFCADNSNSQHQYVSVLIQMTLRELLQKLGTEAGRDVVHPLIWINATMAGYTSKQNWIITDVRFPNEAMAILNRGEYLFRIERGEKKQDEHLSETALDNFKNWDKVVNNNFDLGHLRRNAQIILEYIRS